MDGYVDRWIDPSLPTLYFHHQAIRLFTEFARRRMQDVISYHTIPVHISIPYHYHAIPFHASPSIQTSHLFHPSIHHSLTHSPLTCRVDYCPAVPVFMYLLYPHHLGRHLYLFCSVTYLAFLASLLAHSLTLSISVSLALKFKREREGWYLYGV